MKFRLRIDAPDRHVLHVGMIDPGLVLRILVYRDRLPPSFTSAHLQRIA